MDPLASVHVEVKDETDSDKAEDAIVVARNLHKTYLLGVEGVPALRGVSLTIRRGEFVVILGKVTIILHSKVLMLDHACRADAVRLPC